MCERCGIKHNDEGVSWTWTFGSEKTNVGPSHNIEFDIAKHNEWHELEKYGMRLSYCGMRLFSKQITIPEYVICNICNRKFGWLTKNKMSEIRTHGYVCILTQLMRHKIIPLKA